MNMISELRQRVRQCGKAEITAAEYNQLQTEWITRSGIDASAQYDITREAFVANLEQQLAAALAAIKSKDAALQSAISAHGYGSGDLHDALAIQPDDMKGVILCHAEPCRDDGRCQYAIDHGAEGLGHCPDGKCCMPLYRAWEPK